jgi:hypothetical protein
MWIVYTVIQKRMYETLHRAFIWEEHGRNSSAKMEITKNKNPKARP